MVSHLRKRPKRSACRRGRCGLGCTAPRHACARSSATRWRCGQMGKFEDSLWTELQREHGQALLQNMAKRQSRRARRWVGIAAAVTVLGTGALVASTYFGGAPPAYAVVDNPDGSVTLTVREVQRFEEATAKLRERGI